MLYVTWTGDGGQRELRTFPDGGDGMGKLRRYLNRRGIPFQVGWAREAGYAARPAQGQAWRPDPRVWRSLGAPIVPHTETADGDVWVRWIMGQGATPPPGGAA